MERRLFGAGLDALQDRRESEREREAVVSAADQL